MFVATKHPVANRGVCPDSFLFEAIAWARTESDDVFAPNPFNDIYAHVHVELGPFTSILNRKAVMLEAMRVHAGFESSWRFNCGVDITNHTSMTHKTGQETGVFQVSFDSTDLHGGYMKPFANAHGIGTVDAFITRMKSDHRLAFQYYARLVRVNVEWAGPIKRHEIDRYLSRAAVSEFENYLRG